MSQAPMIDVAGVTKRFGAVVAVDNISVGVGAGEFFSLLGPSGCGKTTLLRLIAGFEQPSEGDLGIDGQPMAGVPANQRPTNMVFQSYAIFPHMDVWRNVAYGLRKERPSREEMTRRVEEALDMVNLSGFGHRRANELSGGQRQRVALARALIMRPKVLLLDEPLSALDKKLREQMQIELRRLQRSVGITFVLVTHDQEEAFAMSDNIAVMFDGRIEQIATSTELYQRPASRRVAAFIGGMNFINAVPVGNSGGKVELDTDGFGKIQLGLGDGDPASELVLGIRPERLSLRTADGGAGTVPGRIRDATYYGETTHYYVNVGTRDEPIVVSVSNSSAETALLKEGDDVWLNWSEDALVPLR